MLARCTGGTSVHRNLSTSSRRVQEYYSNDASRVDGGHDIVCRETNNVSGNRMNRKLWGNVYKGNVNIARTPPLEEPLRRRF